MKRENKIRFIFIAWIDGDGQVTVAREISGEEGGKAPKICIYARAGELLVVRMFDIISGIPDQFDAEPVHGMFVIQ